MATLIGTTQEPVIVAIVGAIGNYTIYSRWLSFEIKYREHQNNLQELQFVFGKPRTS